MGKGWGRGEGEPFSWEPGEWGGGHLAGDEVFAHRQGHLDGVGLVGDGGGVELDLPGRACWPDSQLPRNICSCFRVLSTAPMLTILGSQAARAGRQEKQGESQQAHGAHGLRAAPWLWAALNTGPSAHPQQEAPAVLRARSRGRRAPRLPREP